jgi:hypothetical protein
VARLLGLACSALILLVACTPAAPQSRFVAYQYAAEVPIGPFAPGEVVSVEWVPKELSTDRSDVYDVQLCVGFFGPWDSPQALKDQNRPDAQAACPLTDAKVASQLTRARSNIGTRLTTRLVAPSTPGFYDLRQIVITGGNAMLGGSVVEIRAR